MASAGAAASAYSTGDIEPAILLDRLRDAHAAVLAAMEVLDRMTRGPLCDRSCFNSPRWRISAANRARRAVQNECFRALLPSVDPRTAQALEALRRQDVDLARHSAAHIARWPADAIEREWPAYCAASRAIRGRMGAAIEAEKRLLYPLLRVQSLGRRPSV